MYYFYPLIIRLLGISFCLVSLLFSSTAFAKQLATLETSKGNIVIELHEELAPNTVANFKQYVESDFYNNTIFHRVIEGFMIQGGGFDQKFSRKKPKQAIKNEANKQLKNIIGSVAMARTNQPHSATSQFFINVNNNASLDFVNESPRGWGYAVFGQVIEGMDIVMGISQVKTGNKSRHQNVPVENIIILDAYLTQK